MVPGFLNAHTHPELNRLAGRLPRGRDFVRWLQALFACRVGETAESIRAALAEAAHQSRAQGVTGWGPIQSDPTMDGPAIDQFHRAGLRSRLFLEITGLAPEVADERFGRLHERLVRAGQQVAALSAEKGTARRPPPPSPIALATSPHAPYSVSPDLFRRCFAQGRAGGAPVCVHLAETPEEEVFCRTGRGPLADFVRDLGVMPPDWRPPGLRPIPYLAEQGLGQTAAVIAHANYASDDEIRWMGRQGLSVVYCPPSHRFFGHAPYPLAAMLRAGVNLCLATDSLASSDTLSPLEAAREALARHSDLTPEMALAMITLHPARALGWAGRVGALRPGMAADMVALDVPDGAGDDPLRAALATDAPPRPISPALPA